MLKPSLGHNFNHLLFSFLHFVIRVLIISSNRDLPIIQIDNYLKSERANKQKIIVLMTLHQLNLTFS